MNVPLTRYTLQLLAFWEGEKLGNKNQLVFSQPLYYVVDNPADPAVRSTERISIIPHSCNQTEFLINNNFQLHFFGSESLNLTDFKL